MRVYSCRCPNDSKHAAPTLSKSSPGVAVSLCLPLWCTWPSQVMYGQYRSTYTACCNVKAAIAANALRALFRIAGMQSINGTTALSPTAADLIALPALCQYLMWCSHCCGGPTSHPIVCEQQLQWWIGRCWLAICSKQDHATQSETM